MIPKVQAAARHVIERALRDIDAGSYDAAAATLRELIGAREFRTRSVPIVQPASSLSVPGARVVSHPGVHDGGRPFVVAPMPKPQKRIEDPAAVDAYREAHPVCEVAGPDCWYAHYYPEGHPRAGQPKAEVHHIVKRSMSGSADVAANFLSLCSAHHTGNVGWHTLTPPKWFARFIDRLSTLALAKVSYFVREKAWNPALTEAA